MEKRQIDDLNLAKAIVDKSKEQNGSVEGMVLSGIMLGRVLQQQEIINDLIRQCKSETDYMESLATQKK